MRREIAILRRYGAVVSARQLDAQRRFKWQVSENGSTLLKLPDDEPRKRTGLLINLSEESRH